MSELRHYLRDATAEQHRQLDSQPALQRLGAAFRHVEEVLAELPLPENLEVPTYLPRYPAISRDLMILQLPSSPAPERLTLPSVITAFTTLGIRYVIEGSSQGSVHILRKLSSHLPELATIGALNYWQVQARAGQDWPFLCEVMMREYSKSQRQQALNGAAWTFRCFSQAFA